MCALAPWPISNWPLINPISYEQNFIYGGSESIESFLQFPSPQSKEESLLDYSQSPASFDQTCSIDPCMVKKINHNASERDRRKKVNSLYSSLRSLLPAANQMKKLSFPATVSHALKYIPELQEQVESLVQKKEELLFRISQQGGAAATASAGGLKIEDQQRKNRNNNGTGSSAAVSINRLSDSEVAIQISMSNKLEPLHKTQYLSEILHFLEQQGFLLLNASSFESFGAVFYNIHLQVDLGTNYKVLESDQLLCVLLSDNREDPFATLNY